MRIATSTLAAGVALLSALAIARIATTKGSPASAATNLAPLPPPTLASAKGPRRAAIGGDDGDIRSHAVDVVDYTFRARLDPETHGVHGEGTLRWTNTSERPVHEVWLHLYLNAFKNDRSAFLRERVGGRGSAMPTDFGRIDLRAFALRGPDGRTDDLLPGIEFRRPGDLDETDARVPLPREVAPHESIEMSVVWDDKLPKLVERTGYVDKFHMVGQWFPKIARIESDGTWAHFPFHHLSEFYADFGTYDVTLDVPKAYTIGATGPAVEKQIVGGRRVERHVQSDIHDFAWTAWDQWQTARETVDGVSVTVLYPPGFERVAQRDLEAVKFALPYDSSRYGAYPYSVLTVVHPEQEAREAGGMEYPTLITAEGAWWTPSSVLAPEIVTVHELGHQWFYGLVATNEAAWPFLDEGLNQFAEVDAMAKWKGEGSAVDLLGLRVSDAALQAVAGNLGVHDEPIAQEASAFSTGAKYGQLVYARTAAILATLERVYGDDAMTRALGGYTRRFRFEHPGPRDLLSVFAKELGDKTEATLRTALFDKGWVDYAVDDVWCRRTEAPAGTFDRAPPAKDAAPGEDQFEGGVIVRRRGTLSFPVDVDLTLANGSVRRQTWSGDGEETRIPFRGPIALVAARVDPDDRILIDENPQNNAGKVPSASSTVPRTFERLAYFAELAMQWIGP